MKYEKVVIKQIPDESAISFGLDKYGRSKMPRTYEGLSVAESAPGSGYFITGLDDKGLELNAIRDPDEREKVAEERKAVRSQLEKYLGEGKLDPRSDFWKREFQIRISSDDKTMLSNRNPMDVVTYHAAIANGYIAPDERSAALPQYRNCKYYFHVEDIVNDELVSTVKKRDKARGELLKLDDDKDKLVLIGQYLEGAKYKLSMRPSTLYTMLSDYINDTKNPEKLGEFVKAMKLSNEELQYKVNVETAIRKKIIKYRDGMYYFGSTGLGRNAVDVLKSLKTPEFTNEYLSIEEIINE